MSTAPEPIKKEPNPYSRRAIREQIKGQPFNRAEVRRMVDLYYQIQDFRKAGTNQEKAAARSDESSGGYAQQVQDQMRKIEDGIKIWLDENTELSPVCRWTKSICGIGPVIAAGLAAHIDIRQAPTVGHIWRFAGLDPTQKWLGAEKARAAVKELTSEHGQDLESVIPILAGRIGCKVETLRKFATSKADGNPVKLTSTSLAKAGAKRPWNAALKVLCWHIGESFVKVHNLESDIYGKIYSARKAVEEGKNARGDFGEQATAILAAKDFGKNTEARQWYIEGKLPPGHIHARAKRYAVKLFLSHWHWVAYESEFGCAPPKPYVLEHLGHADLLRPPNWAAGSEVIRRGDA